MVVPNLSLPPKVFFFFCCSIDIVDFFFQIFVGTGFYFIVSKQHSLWAVCCGDILSPGSSLSEVAGPVSQWLHSFWCVHKMRELQTCSIFCTACWTLRFVLLNGILCLVTAKCTGLLWSWFHSTVSNNIHTSNFPAQINHSLQHIVQQVFCNKKIYKIKCIMCEGFLSRVAYLHTLVRGSTWNGSID